jgi:hypothetical protein
VNRWRRWFGGVAGRLRLERCLHGSAIGAGECRRVAGMLLKALGHVDHPFGRARAFPGDMRLAAANAADKLLHELFGHVRSR